MVEFVLIAPLFFAIVFAIAEGGMMLYIYNSSQHAASRGALILAAEGNAFNTDTDAITEMRTHTDFGGSGLITITEYDIYLLKADGSNKRDTTGCGGTGCFQRYSATGAQLAGNWPTTTRQTTSANADYVELDIHYDYHYFVTPGALSLTTQRFFRLEPQSS